MYINEETKEYPITENEIRIIFCNTSFSKDFCPPDGFSKVVESEKPVFDQETEKISEAKPKKVGNEWVQQWDVIPLSKDEINSRTIFKIAVIEATITPRRVREAVLGVDGGWLKNVDSEISKLRESLK